MDRIALIAGAHGGIGSAICKELEASGYLIGRLGRSLVESKSKTSISVKFDVTDRSSVFAAVNKVNSHFGKIDLFVNSVGVSNVNKFDETTSDDIRSLFEINVIGSLWMYQAVASCMKKQKAGYIIHIGSLRSSMPGMNKAAYCSSKAAATQLTAVLGKENKKHGIKVTTIQPGYVNTKIYKNTSQKIPFEAKVKSGEVDIAYFVDSTEPSDIGKIILCLDSLSKTTHIEEVEIGRLWGE